MIFAVYDIVSGEILKTVELSPISSVDAAYQATLQTEPGQSYLAVSDGCQDDTHYIDAGVERAKSVSPITIDKTSINADGVDIATFSSVPDGAEVFESFSPSATVTGGIVQFMTDKPGVTHIHFKHVQYLDFEVEINAT